MLNLRDVFQFVVDGLNDVSFPQIDLDSGQFSEYHFHKVLHLQRSSVVHVSRGESKVENLPPLLVDDQVQLEAEEPPHGALASHGDSFEHFVAVDTAVVAHAQRGRVNETHACAFTQTVIGIRASLSSSTNLLYDSNLGNKCEQCSQI